jgi:hypothetical protein
MPKSAEERESHLAKACKAARAQEKPKIAKIVREFGVPYRTLYGRVHDGKQARTARKAPYTALDKYQEEALIQWVS